MGALKQMKFTLDKTRITNHKVEWLHNYSKFADLYDFNNEYEKIMVDKKKKFTKVQHAILNVIRHFAAKVPGVANASYKTYNKELHKVLGHTVHNDTIKNTLKKAEKMGVCLVVAGKRLNGSYTANVIVFNRADEVRAYELAQLEKEEREIKKQIEQEFAQMSPALQYAHNAKVWAQEKAQKDAEKAAESKRKEQQAKVASFEQHKTEYQKLKDELQNVFEDKKDIYKAYGAWKSQKDKMIKKPSVKIAIDAAKALKMEMKKRYDNQMKPLNNPIGYYNRIISNMIDSWLEQGAIAALQEEGLI